MESTGHGDITVGGPSLVPKLEVIQGDRVGKTYTLKFKTRIGRETDNDIAIPDPKISRYHCQISFEDGRWLLSDLGSANGTQLNGLPVNVPQSLSHGSQVGLGETILVFVDPLEEKEKPFDPASTIVGGSRPPAPLGAETSSNTPMLAWIAGGLILILMLAVAIGVLWLGRNRQSAPSQEEPSASTATLVRTTPHASSNLELKFEDDFSNSNSGWDDSFGKDYTKQYGNNQYHVEITTNNLVVWGLANRNAADFETEVEATLNSNEPGNTYGLIFRYVDDENYYRFDVSSDGYFLLTKFQNGQWTTLIDWTASPAINQGGTNVLKIRAFGPEITLWANGEELGSVIDDSFQQGNFGFFASTFEEPHVWVTFDNLKLWSPAEQAVAIIPTATPVPSLPKNTPTPAAVEAVIATATLEAPTQQATQEIVLVELTPTVSETPAAQPESTPGAIVETDDIPSAQSETAPLPDFVTRNQPLARGEQVLPGKLVFPLFDNATGTYNIYRSNTDGSDRELIVTEASQPALNQAGDIIAYRSWKADERGLISRRIGSEEKWNFVQFFEAAAPVFSNDEQFFLFHSRQGGPEPALYRTQGTEHEVLRRDGFPIQGEMIAITRNGQMVYRGCMANSCGLILSNLDGSFPLQLTDYADDTNPAVSPDGTTVAFMSNRSGNWDIYTIGLDGNNLQQLTTDPGNDGLPAWSPNGNFIVFVSNRDGQWAMWDMTALGQRKRQLFELQGTIDGIVQLDTQNAFGWIQERIVWTP